MVSSQAVCHQGHTLTKGHLEVNWACDGCGTQYGPTVVPPGQKCFASDGVYQCRRCNFDLCVSCYEKQMQRMPSAKSNEEPSHSTAPAEKTTTLPPSTAPLPPAASASSSSSSWWNIFSSSSTTPQSPAAAAAVSSAATEKDAATKKASHNSHDACCTSAKEKSQAASAELPHCPAAAALQERKLIPCPPDAANKAQPTPLQPPASVPAPAPSPASSWWSLFSFSGNSDGGTSALSPAGKASGLTPATATKVHVTGTAAKEQTIEVASSSPPVHEGPSPAATEKKEKKPSAAVRCPGGHVLEGETSLAVPEGGTCQCDVCHQPIIVVAAKSSAGGAGEELPPVVVVWSCRLCNFDICPKCCATRNTVDAAMIRDDATSGTTAPNGFWGASVAALLLGVDDPRQAALGRSLHRNECMAGHPLASSPSSSVSWNCDACGMTKIDGSVAHLRCAECDFDVCNACVERAKKQHATESTQPRCAEGHFMRFTMVSLPWVCDRCHDREREATEVHYNCRSCNYDVCTACCPRRSVA